MHCLSECISFNKSVLTIASKSLKSKDCKTKAKFKHATCGLDKWDNVKGVYFRTASNIKRSGFDKATINDMKAERLATGFAEVASLTEGNFETATEAVGVYETPINGVAKRVIVTYDHFVERTTQNLAASKFMIKVKIEK